MGSLEVEAVLAARDMSRRVKEQYTENFGIDEPGDPSATLRLFKDEVFQALETQNVSMTTQLIEGTSLLSPHTLTSPSPSIKVATPHNHHTHSMPSPRNLEPGTKEAGSVAKPLENEIQSEPQTHEQEEEEEEQEEEEECRSPLHWAQVGESMDVDVSKRFHAESYVVRSEWNPSSGTVQRMARPNTYHVAPELLTQRAEEEMATIRLKMAQDKSREAAATRRPQFSPQSNSLSPYFHATSGGGTGMQHHTTATQRIRPMSAMPAWDASRRGDSAAAGTTARAAPHRLPPSGSGRFSNLPAPQSLVPRSRPVSAQYSKIQSRLLAPTTAYLNKVQARPQSASGATHHIGSASPPNSRVQSARPQAKLRPASAPTLSGSVARPGSARGSTISRPHSAARSQEEEEEDELSTVCILPIKEEPAADEPNPCFIINPRSTFDNMLKSYEAAY